MLRTRISLRNLSQIGTPARSFSINVSKRPLKRSDRKVAHVSFSGNKKHPILDLEAMQKLTETFHELDRDPETSAVFLRSTFAGADLNLMSSFTDSKPAEHFIASIKQICDTIYSFRSPVIAIVNGPCLGAGMELVASCDLRVAVEDTAIFAMPETLLSIPSIAQASLLPGLIGWGRARELLYFGGSIDAKQARDWGFVNTLTDSHGLEETVAQYEDKIDATGTGALEAQKRVMAAWQAHDAGVLGNTAEINRQFADCVQTGEPSRVMTAFLEAKRKKKESGVQ